MLTEDQDTIVKSEENETLEEARRAKVKPTPLVAQGLHRESKLDLYLVYFEGNLQTSAFLYPTTIAFTPSRIRLMDARFTDIGERFISREFKDTALEDLNSLFLREAKPAIPFMTHDYTIYKPRVIEHSFVPGSEVYLERVIREMKG